METYSSAPFISKDGPDSDGYRAEIKVVKGRGKVFDIEESDKGKSAKVIFKVENTKYKSYGWVPLDQKVYEVAAAAKENDEIIEFRIETRRRDNLRADPNQKKIPINDLTSGQDAKETVVKSLAAVKRLDDDNWVISSFAKTRFDEDPSSGSAPSANDYTVEQLRELDKNNTPVSGVGENYGFEGSPYSLYREEKKINYGSHAVGVGLEVYRDVNHYIKEKSLEENEMNKIKITNNVISAAKALQVAVYNGDIEEADMSVPSFQRAIKLVFDAMDLFFPLDNEIISDDDKINSWREDVVTKMSKMWNWSAKLAQ